MGWLASLGFSDIFVDCLIAMGRYFPSMIYVLWSHCVDYIKYLGIIVGCKRAWYDHWEQHSSTDSDSIDR